MAGYGEVEPIKEGEVNQEYPKTPPDINIQKPLGEKKHTNHDIFCGAFLMYDFKGLVWQVGYGLQDTMKNHHCLWLF